jgi:hypothetical protein
MNTTDPNFDAARASEIPNSSARWAGSELPRGVVFFASNVSKNADRIVSENPTSIEKAWQKVSELNAQIQEQVDARKNFVEEK